MDSRNAVLQPDAIRDLLVVLLAAISGYVDAVSYLGLEHVFTANMTGNTVLLGLAIGGGDHLAALRSGVALGGYIIGVGIGAGIVHSSKQGEIWPAAVTRALAFEALVLFVLAVGGWFTIRSADDLHLRVYPLIALSAVSMGLQSAAVRPLSVPGITTTYITGTWTSLVSVLAVRLHLIRADSAAKPRPAATGATLQAGVLVVYGIAAIAGGAAYALWNLPVFVVPAIVMALVVVLALSLLHDVRAAKTA